MKRVAIILVKGPGKTYLMGTRKDNGKMTFPAGHINDKEEPKDGARRELKEETGFDAKQIDLKHTAMPAPGECVYVYEVQVSGAPNLALDPDLEFQSIYYKDPNQISYSDWHIKPDKNVALQFLRA